MKRIFLFICYLFLLVTWSFADELNDSMELYNYYISKGYEYHTRAFSGEKCAQEAINMFQKACDINSNSTSLAWLGSSWALKGNEENAVIKKMNCVYEGIDYLDKAVLINPNDVMARRIRIETYSALPNDIFKKTDIIQEDLRFLMKLYITDKNCFNDQYDGAWSYYYYGLRLIKNGDLKNGRKYLQMARTYVQDPELRDEIVKLLGGK